MINLGTLFWLLVGFFALIGALRGWTREVIVTAGLILSLFALNLFGPSIASALGGQPNPAIAVDLNGLRRRQYYVLVAIHLAIAIFSYQGPALGGRALAQRLRVRDSLQDKVMGALVGAVNGYLIVGTLWAFLELQIGPNGYTPLPPNTPYPFDPGTIIRPDINSPLISLIERLPLPMLAPYLPYLLIVIFLFLIIVMI